MKTDIQKSDEHLKRCAALYTLMQSIPKELDNFYMGSWAKHSQRSECGTKACMGGHAAMHPWFRERGLMLTMERGCHYANIEYAGHSSVIVWHCSMVSFPS